MGGTAVLFNQSARVSNKAIGSDRETASGQFLGELEGSFAVFDEQDLAQEQVYQRLDDGVAGDEFVGPANDVFVAGQAGFGGGL